MARTKKNAEGSRTPKSKMTVVQKKAPVAKKTFKGNAKTIDRAFYGVDSVPGTWKTIIEETPQNNIGGGFRGDETVSAPKRTPPISVKPLSKKEKVPEKTSKKRHKNDLLVRRDNIENMSDLNGLKQAANDKVRFHSEALKQPYAEAYQLSPEGEAVSTGQQNYHMLGHATANIEMTRGGREGNNALLCHDVGCSLSLDSQVEIFLEKNSGYYASKIVHAVRYGNRKLAGKLIETYSSYNFNDLHTQTLLNDHQPLKALMAVEPNFNVPDTQNWSCYLCYLPLHCAARAGRAENVKGNASMVNAKAQNGMTPLHMAAEKGHEEVVRVLLAESDINVDVQTAAGNKKLTPLMVACRMGFKGDKLKRTALTHAVMNGQNHVVAMLLRRGASPCTPDSSGNTPAHYATAYGWLECLELLAKADPSCLGINNDWHLAPLAVAYLKGHVGIVEWLVGGPYSEEVTVNCCDQAGVSLVSSVINCYSYISSKDILTQLEYLALKGADCSLKDTAMNTPLHFFASKNAILRNDNGVRNDFDSDENNSRLTKEEYRKCFHLIVERGAGPFDKNEAGDCPFHIALKTGNLFLVECLLNKMCDEGLNLHSLEEKTSAKSNSGNILHSLLKLPFKVYENRSVWASRLGPTGGQYNIIPVLNKFISMDSTQMIAWLNEKDREGRTPLVLLCHKYTMTAADQQNSCCEEDRKNAYINFEQFLYTMCAVSELADSLDFADTCSALSDDDVVEVTEDVDKGAEKRAQHVNIITYGLMGNDVHHRVAASFSVRGKEYKIKNKLLTTIIEAAKESNILAKLLSERDANEYTPLLYAVNEGDMCRATKPTVYYDRAYIDATHGQHPNEEANAIGQYPLHVAVNAVRSGDTDVLTEPLEWLIQNGDGIHSSTGTFAKKLANCFNTATVIPSEGVLQMHRNEHAGKQKYRWELTRTLMFIGVEGFQFLLNKKKLDHTDILDSFGRLPLHYAFVGTDDDALRDTSTIDPIAVVSILEQAMDESKMDTADNLGNTPLHYAAQRGANICTVTLLRYGCDVNRVNNEGNTPLGIAVLHGNEACTLTLIQAKSNIVVQFLVTTWILLTILLNEQVISRGKPTTAKRENWIWIPKRSKAEVLVKKANVASLVVRNGWQGIIYVILDTYCKEAGDAQSIARKVAVVNELNLFQVFVTNLKSATMDDNVTKVVIIVTPNIGAIIGTYSHPKLTHSVADTHKIFFVQRRTLYNSLCLVQKYVFEELLSAGIKWYSEDNDGILKSPSIEHLARHRHFELLNALKKWDAESPHPMGSLIVFTNGNENPLVGIVESWIHSGSVSGGAGSSKVHWDDRLCENRSSRNFSHVCLFTYINLMQVSRHRFVREFEKLVANIR
uniref:PARP n=1 Tax=Parascaris equorum TaxID=6256 RepID=A0A914RY24_PAREQ